MTGAFEPFPCWNGRKVYWALAFLRFYFALSRSGYSHPLLIKLGSHFQTLPATTSRVLTKQTANYSVSLFFLLSLPSQIHKLNILIQVSTSHCLPLSPLPTFPGSYAFEPFPKGRCKKTVFWGDFVPNIRPHPPTARVWDSTKWKIKVKFILLFRLFGAFYFFEEMSSFSDKIPCIYLGLWTPTHPPPPLFWDRVLKKTGFYFH